MVLSSLLVMTVTMKSSRASAKSVIGFCSIVNIDAVYCVVLMFAFAGYFSVTGTGFSEAVLEARSSSLRSQVINEPKVSILFFFYSFFMII